MSKSILWKVFSGAMILGLLLSACGGGATTAAPAAPSTAPATGGGSAPITASSGFVCPEPNPRMDVTSKELNLFVWTEYIPQDMSECFEKEYGIKVNRDEYSSNEEMYAKISAG